VGITAGSREVPGRKGLGQETSISYNNNNNNNNNNKVMHGQYIRNIDRQLNSEEDMFLWLLKGDLKAETESEIVAAQDQVLQTKYYATKILSTETDSKCRLANNLTRQ